jgi:two-component system CheB/CheR fusion protein
LTFAPDEHLEALLEYLRDSRGFDFTGYKRTTLARRIEKRYRELGFDSVPRYLDHLQVHSEEFAILFDKILINVTEFFRDRPAWSYLEQELIPRIIERGGPIRVWSAGTASGEEAYSAAVLLCEALGPKTFLQRVKIYATDIDEQALTKARAGSYSPDELEPMDPEIRSRYFEPHNGRMAFQPALRRALIFGIHDLMQDAPISHLDLLICRNTLIYFTAEAQERILTRFHYALKEDGYLFLGKAEMLLTHGSLFAPTDLKRRIFNKVPRLALGDGLTVLAQSRNSEATNQIANELRIRELASETAPFAQVVVDAAGILAIANEQTRAMFNIGPGDTGRPFKDLEISYRPVDLRSPIDQSSREKRAISIAGVQHIRPDGVARHLDIQVIPLLDESGGVAGTGITFIDVTHTLELRMQLDRSKQELDTAFEELQSANEELETTNEELQSTIEELETTNEELQSTNEELETMNEELESTNSELQTINADLHQRSEEVARFNVLLHSITGNIPLGAAVMDANLRVTVWNERAADLWGLRSDEVVGRSLFDLDVGLPTDQIRNMTNAVLTNEPAHDDMIVDAVNRRGKPIRCRVRASFFSDGNQSGSVVLIMEEMALERPAGRTV